MPHFEQPLSARLAVLQAASKFKALGTAQGLVGVLGPESIFGEVSNVISTNMLAAMYDLTEKDRGSMHKSFMSRRMIYVHV